MKIIQIETEKFIYVMKKLSFSLKGKRMTKKIILSILLLSISCELFGCRKTKPVSENEDKVPVFE